MSACTARLAAAGLFSLQSAAAYQPDNHTGKTNQQRTVQANVTPATLPEGLAL
tara:strand:- start:5 stop:163 length:159 start_codon:yes stop_codon:yes gene_type:complete